MGYSPWGHKSDATEQRSTRAHTIFTELGPPAGSAEKNPPANAGDVGSTPGLGRSPGERNGNPLHCLCLGNPMDRGA